MPEWSKLGLLPMEHGLCECCGKTFIYFRLNQPRRYCVACRRVRVRAQSLRAKHKQRGGPPARKVTSNVSD